MKELYQHLAISDLLTGLELPDDAAIWRLDDTRGLVVTTDFFTPVVDNPYDYGAIAAANSLSDVYAMGGQPFLALNIAALPPNLPVDFLSEIMRGGAEKALEAGVIIAGGHTVQDKEPKFGLVALGFVDLDKIITKSGASVDEVLVLTKPLGFGCITTALKQQKVQEEDLVTAVDWMKRLNHHASQIATKCHVRGGTDVTGFGLLGHALEVAEASEVRLEFNLQAIPHLAGSESYASNWIFPGGTFDNNSYYAPRVEFDGAIDEVSRLRLFDPQTSGGLLLCVPPDHIETFRNEARRLGQPWWEVGKVTEGTGVSVLDR